jgi:hypothetical protein
MHAGRVWLGRSEETFYKPRQNKSCVPRIYSNIIGNSHENIILTYARKIKEEKPLKYEKTK